MSDLGCPIPPLNRETQENYMIMFDVEENPYEDETGPKTTHLRWLLDRIEKELLVYAIIDGIANNSSNFEPSCPVCLEDYITPSEETVPRSGKRSQLNEKPLKLYCGHVLGHKCFHRIMKLQGGGNRKCPLCRSHIHTFHSNPPLLYSKIPLIHRNGQWSMLGGLCCAIRLFICINLTQPEISEALHMWVYSPLLEQLVCGGPTQEEVLYIAIMRWAVDRYCRKVMAR